MTAMTALKQECENAVVVPVHNAVHLHGLGCGHVMIKHGDHHDFIVNGIKHHTHRNHCDNHGPLTEADMGN